MHGRVVCVAAAVVAFAGCEVNLNSEGIVSRETKKFTVAGPPLVQLQTFDGAIEIHSWDRQEVEVEIGRRAMEQGLVDEMKIVAEQQGDTIVVRVTGPTRSWDSDAIQIGVNFSPTARLRVVVPRESAIDAKSDDGSINVEDIVGRVTLTTGDGSVRATRVSGEMLVRSGDGAIRMDAVEGKLDLETEDGSIVGEARPTSLRAHTGDGTIRLEVLRDAKMANDWDVQTADGSVVLTLPSDFNAELDVQSRDGAVRTTHPAIRPDAERVDGEESTRQREERRRALKTTLGSGGKTLRVRSGDGSIRIES